ATYVKATYTPDTGPVRTITKTGTMWTDAFTSIDFYQRDNTYLDTGWMDDVETIR
ncbi:unnamed protein product, partial [marine sediment metagenome]